MDASTRLAEVRNGKKSDGVDYSDDLRFMLGVKPPVSPGNLKYGEYHIPLEVVIGLAKPVMKYLPGFEAACEHSRLNGATMSLAKTVIDWEKAKFPEGITANTRIILIGEISSARTNTAALEKKLFLADNGVLLISTGEFSLVPNDRSHVKDLVAIEFEFEAITPEDIWERIRNIHRFPGESDDDWRKLYIHAMGVLEEAIDKGIATRETHLKTLHETRERVKDILWRTDRRR